MAMLYIGSSSSSLTAISVDPSVMTFGKQDISAADAGRTQSGKMYKMLVTSKRTLDLTWWYPTADVVAEVLQAVADEYFYVRYYDWEDGKWETRQFYCGDRSAPVKWQNNGRTDRAASLTFQVIER